MVGRDPGEPHRAATPLELLFDLCFVVAIAQLGLQLHHSEAESHAIDALPAYMVVFFCIWWAWMNFTWFASAYDTDDVPYRLLTLLQIAGVLVIAAGVPSAFERFDFTITVMGYIVMRVAMVLQWLRAAHECPATRRASLRYATGVGLAQIGWLIRLALPSPWNLIAFVVLGVTELLIPIWAETSGQVTPWHPAHIAERYGLFTIIVLGECVLAAMMTIQAAIAESGPTLALLATGGGALVLIFGLWWSYFKSSPIEVLHSSDRSSFLWGYGNFFVFASVAALGAGLQVAAESTRPDAHIGATTAALMVALPVVVFVVAVGLLHRVTDRQPVDFRPIGIAVVLFVLAALASPIVSIAGAVLLMGLVTVLLVANHVFRLGQAPGPMSAIATTSAVAAARTGDGHAG